MAGKKGMKGGGGRRPGAGRKPKKRPTDQPNQAAVAIELEPQPHGGALKRSHAEPVQIEAKDMLDLLEQVALGKVEATSLQVRAAIAAVQYRHPKAGDGGKKDEQADRARKASAGKFAPSAAPRLVVNNKR